MPTAVSLDLLYREFYLPRKLLGVTDSTREKYRISLSHFARFLGHSPTVEDLDDDIVSSFPHWLVKQGLAPETANSYQSKIAALWDYLGRKRKAPDRPAITSVRAPRKKPVGWNHEELSRLFRACGEVPGLICDIPARLWWVAIHEVARETGERIGAILKLRWDDFDPETRILTRRAETRKGRTEDMVSRLSIETTATLALIRYPERDLIFPWEKHRSSIWNNYNSILRSAGLPMDRKRKFHCIRKTSASEVASLGGDPQRFLGHFDQATTRSYLVPEIVNQIFDGDRFTRVKD